MRKWILAIFIICLLSICGQEVVDGFRPTKPDEALIVETVLLPKANLLDTFRNRGNGSATVLIDSWYKPLREEQLPFDAFVKSEITEAEKEILRMGESNGSSDEEYVQKCRSNVRSLEHVQAAVARSEAAPQRGLEFDLKKLPLHGDIFPCGEDQDIYGKSMKSKSGKEVSGFTRYQVSRPIFSKDRHFAYVIVYFSYEHFSIYRYVLEKRRREWRVVAESESNAC